MTFQLVNHHGVSWMEPEEKRILPRGFHLLSGKSCLLSLDYRDITARGLAR